MMPSRRTPVKLIALAFSAALAAPLAFVAPAAAKPLFTPPVGVNGTATAACVVQNVTTKARSVSAVIRDQSGGQILAHEESVPAGAVVTFVSADQDYGFYCEFEGLGKGVRGYMHVYDGTTLLVLPAAK
jgi:hypothetical protein